MSSTYFDGDVILQNDESVYAPNRTVKPQNGRSDREPKKAHFTHSLPNAKHDPIVKIRFRKPVWEQFWLKAAPAQVKSFPTLQL